jgi:ketosteroid isomerase-like protein
MTSENLDPVRSIYAAWERRDYASAKWAQRDVELVIADGPTPGRWRGAAGLTQEWRDFLGAWEDFRVRAQEFRELDGERVLALVHFNGRGKSSGVEVGQVSASGVSLFHIRDSKVTQQVFYFDRQRALADLGLAPEGDPRR